MPVPISFLCAEGIRSGEFGRISLSLSGVTSPLCPVGFHSPADGLTFCLAHSTPGLFGRTCRYSRPRRALHDCCSINRTKCFLNHYGLMLDPSLLGNELRKSGSEFGGYIGRH